MVGSRAVATYQIEFYEDEHGDQPVLRWLREDLAPEQRRVLGFAMREVLQAEGVDVCGTEYGRHLGRGLFEFRLGGTVGDYLKRPGSGPAADQKLLLRVFCHAHGDKLILLLAGYDKLANTSKTHQNAQIELARERLRSWQLRHKKAKAHTRRRSS